MSLIPPGSSTFATLALDPNPIVLDLGPFWPNAFSRRDPPDRLLILPPRAFPLLSGDSRRSRPSRRRVDRRFARLLQEMADREQFLDRGEILVFGSVKGQRVPVSRHPEVAIVLFHHIGQSVE